MTKAASSRSTSASRGEISLAAVFFQNALATSTARINVQFPIHHKRFRLTAFSTGIAALPQSLADAG